MKISFRQGEITKAEFDEIMKSAEIESIREEALEIVKASQDRYPVREVDEVTLVINKSGHGHGG